MNPGESVVIGIVGGLISVFGVPLFDKLKIDDPVGALTVHGLGGIWVRKLFEKLYPEASPIN